MKRFITLAVLVTLGCSAPTDKNGETPIIITGEEDDGDDANNGTDPSPNGSTNRQTSNDDGDDDPMPSRCEVGDCDEGEACVDGYCQVEGCEPQCDGRTCGSNGCGGVCGTCDGGASCDGGECVREDLSCSGFSEQPTDWTLPDLGIDELLDEIAGSEGCGGSFDINHGLVDLAGDGRADLIVTDACDATGVGTDRWEVYENTGSGFSPQPSTWSLPPVPVDDALDRLGGSFGCPGDGALEYATVELTGDGRPDLVVVDRCDTSVGTTHWEVYENTGSGFAAQPTDWSLPTMPESDLLDTIGGSEYCDAGMTELQSAHGLVDFTDDGLVDLVVTDRCDVGGVGTSHWEVYENTGAGFADQPIEWSLPDSELRDAADRLSGVTTCSFSEGTDVVHTTMDLNGDGRVELVVTDGCDLEGVGTDHWEVYENTGSGFTAQPTVWSLPTPHPDWPDLFVRTVATRSCGGRQDFTFSTLDVSADGLPDLVVTDNCDEEGIGTDSWEVYENTGDGFAAQPLVWDLPDEVVSDVMSSVAGTESCGNGQNVRFSTLDLAGSHALELVVTDWCDAAGTGTDRWQVFSATCD